MNVVKRIPAKKPGRVHVVVCLDVPEGATVAEVLEYIDDSVVSMCGSLRPSGALHDNDEGDPLFYLDRNSVRVAQLSTK